MARLRHFPRTPSWRNTGWLKRNPWFEAELMPTCAQPPSGNLIRHAQALPFDCRSASRSPDVAGASRSPRSSATRMRHRAKRAKASARIAQRIEREREISCPAQAADQRRPAEARDGREDQVVKPLERKVPAGKPAARPTRPDAARETTRCVGAFQP